ncbi:MAG: hypothetical protein O2983_00300, partial [Planctomycetota bacterium]|nr:hypothetical protein [Planctomycetota bacterium]
EPPVSIRNPQAGRQQAPPTSETASAPDADRPFRIRRQVGPVVIEAEWQGDGTTTPKLSVKVTNRNGRDVLVGTADAIGFRDRAGDVSLTLSKARLQVPMPGGHRLEARELRLSARTATDDIPEASIRLELDDAAAWLEHAEQGHSRLQADRLLIVLNAATTDVEQLDGEGLKLLKTSQVLVSPDANTIYDILNRKSDASFLDVSLADAIRTLAQQHGVNIVLDKRGLEEEGVALNEKLSIEVSGISLSSVLKLILDPLNLGTRIGEDDVIIVTSRQRVAGELDVRVYPVAALVVPISDRVSIHTDAESGVAAPPVTSPAPQLDFEKLIALITSTVEPDSWSEVGGSGSIAANETTLSLVIRQTPAVHAEIADLLDQLRRLQDIQVSVQMQTFEVPESFLRDWDVDLLFRSLSESKSHRYMRLSPAQVEQLRRGSKVTQLPKVTLFNGQAVNWSLDTAAGSPQTWHLQPVASADRRFVRLGVGIDETRADSADSTDPTTAASTAAVPTSVMTIPDRDAILIEVMAPLDADLRATEAPSPGQSQAFQRSPSPRRFLLIQPEIVIVEEEEELLGIDLEK